MTKKCVYCGSDKAITRDHIIPKKVMRNYGRGMNCPKNICYACERCNSRKSDFFLGFGAYRLSKHYKQMMIKMQLKVLKLYPNILAQELPPQKGLATVVSIHYLKIKRKEFVYSYCTN